MFWTSTEENINVKLPERVKVGGFWYTIEEANEELAIRNVAGRTIHEELQIKIKTDRPNLIVREGLHHELFHAAEEILGPDNCLQEYQVRVMSEMMFQILSDNPEVRKFIFEED